MSRGTRRRENCWRVSRHSSEAQGHAERPEGTPGSPELTAPPLLQREEDASFVARPARAEPPSRRRARGVRGWPAVETPPRSLGTRRTQPGLRPPGCLWTRATSSCFRTHSPASALPSPAPRPLASRRAASPGTERLPRAGVTGLRMPPRDLGSRPAAPAGGREEEGGVRLHFASRGHPLRRRPLVSSGGVGGRPRRVVHPWPDHREPLPGRLVPGVGA